MLLKITLYIKTFFDELYIMILEYRLKKEADKVLKEHEKLLINDNWKVNYYHNMNRIKTNEDINECLKRIPFLRQFAIKMNQLPEGTQDRIRFLSKIMNTDLYITFSDFKINEYMGYDMCKGLKYINAELINKILSKAEKDGDLWNNT